MELCAAVFNSQNQVCQDKISWMYVCSFDPKRRLERCVSSTGSRRSTHYQQTRGILWRERKRERERERERVSKQIFHTRSSIQMKTYEPAGMVHCCCGRHCCGYVWSLLAWAPNGDLSTAAV